MTDELKDQALTLLGKLDNDDLKNQVTQIQNIDPTEELRKEVLNFFKSRIVSISRSEQLKELVYTELTTMIQGGDLSFDQLLAVLSRIDHDANDSADSLLSIFRPGNNGESLLTELLNSKSDSSDLAKAFAQYSSEDLQAIENTMHTIRAITENNEAKPILEEDKDEI